MKHQNLIAVLFAALLGLFSHSANAVLIDQGNTVLDTDSNLLWLDLSETDGMSYDAAGAAFAADGWVYATEAQYEAMFDSIFTGGYVGDTGGSMLVFAGSDLYDQTVLFREMFGLTYDDDYSTATASYGWYEDGNGILRLGGTYTDEDVARLYRDYAYDYESLRAGGSPNLGTFLVKSASVPEPGTLLLLSLGLAGLGFYRRKVR